MPHVACTFRESMIVPGLTWHFWRESCGYTRWSIMKKRNTKLFGFLLGNMKEMEIELRAQSMVFEALATKVIGVDDLSGALASARNSVAMREMVRTKYLLLAEDLRSSYDAHPVSDGGVVRKTSMPVN